MVQPYLSELLKRSNQRISTNQDFVYIRQDIDDYRKLQADKTISLNEKLRIKEKDEQDARQKARDKELRARKDSNEKIYELTLKQADLPGLPEPVQKTNSLALKNDIHSGTNNVSIKPPPADITESEDDVDFEDKPPLVDANLNEAERILIDYMTLLQRQTPIAATKVR
jgi:carboxyl-terminal processing protease